MKQQLFFSTISRLVLLVAVLLFVTHCSEDKQQQEKNNQESVTTYQVPKFDRDSAYQFVVQQLSFGPRVPNSQGHEDCKNWLLGQFEQFGLEVIAQNFEAKAHTGVVYNSTNIIAQHNPEAEVRVILAAHWDTRYIADSPLSKERREEPIPGADDGGSGVAVLLEIARQLQQSPLPFGVDIILFDAEDQGISRTSDEEDGAEDQLSWCLGSQYWSKNFHKKGYKAQYGILLDMVGAKNARFPKEYYSMQFAPSLVNDIWSLAGRMGYSNYFHDSRVGGITDDHYFVNTLARIPMIDIINLPADEQNQSFGDHWHTHQDDLDIIDARTLRAVGQVILAVLYGEANGTF